MTMGLGITCLNSSHWSWVISSGCASLLSVPDWKDGYAEAGQRDLTDFSSMIALKQTQTEHPPAIWGDWYQWWSSRSCAWSNFTSQYPKKEIRELTPFWPPPRLPPTAAAWPCDLWHLHLLEKLQGSNLKWSVSSNVQTNMFNTEWVNATIINAT